MGKLWQTGAGKTEGLIERFTVGDDYMLDTVLLPADCVAGMAHARMLAAIGVLTEAEADLLVGELGAVTEEATCGRLVVRAEDEDCHTAIENRLVSGLGEVGKKIHTGRSRNDQVIAALRLYTREFLFELESAVLGFAGGLLELAADHSDTPMPGRTHMQIAMPSSVGLWAAAYAEQLLGDLSLLDPVGELNNTSPLGSAASYGVPLPLDRELVADLLGFSGVQNNVLYVNNSRGKLECMVLDGLSQIMITLSKLAQDLILFTLPELQYFRLPAAVCTGSSIMPQKKNPDVLELVRARASSLVGMAAGAKSIVASLPSGYNRDFQETKGYLLRGAPLCLLSVRAMEVAVRGLEVDATALAAAFPPEIHATGAALELVRDGMSFRDAYREIKQQLEQGGPLEGISRDLRLSLEARTSTGTPGNLRLDVPQGEVDRRRGNLDQRRDFVHRKICELAGNEVTFYPD